jgi:hypothetical protein
VADKAYNDALDNVLKTSTGAAKSFPGLKQNGLEDIVNTMRQAQFDASDAVDATQIVRDMATKAYATGDKAMGKSLRGISDAIEDALERHLSAAGNPDALNSFRAARKLIAKTYTVQGALNSQTGSVSAQKLVKSLPKLEGELKTIAETADAFKPSMQSLAQSPKAFSPFDWLAAGGIGGMTGNPLLAIAPAARPGIRSALLSGPVQSMAMRDLAPPASRLAGLSNNEFVRLLYGPGSVAAMNTGQ